MKSVANPFPIPLFIQPLRLRTRTLALIMIGLGMFYGACMGLFGFGGGRELQILISALKVPLLLGLTFMLSLPSFFVINTLLGLRDDFRDAIRALVQTQAALTLILASLAPLTLTWYASTDNYPSAILFNAMMFFIASLSAQLVCFRLYRPLIARNPNHRYTLIGWVLIYAFVGIQMGWVLRPFIGSPGSPVRFFREGAWGNAYIEVLATMSRLLN